MKRELKTMPPLQSNEEAERFVETADLSEYDLSGFKPVRFEFAAKTATLNIRIPKRLFDAVKIKAQRQGLPYSRYIRAVLEQDITN